MINWDHILPALSQCIQTKCATNNGPCYSRVRRFSKLSLSFLLKCCFASWVLVHCDLSLYGYQRIGRLLSVWGIQPLQLLFTLRNSACGKHAALHVGRSTFIYWHLFVCLCANFVLQQPD
jgi:hypothetical protein